MSITNVSASSIQAYHEVGDFASQTEKVARIVELHGPMVGTDVITRLFEELGSNVGRSTAARLGDCQRKMGAIRKTGNRKRSESSGLPGDEWEFVPPGTGRYHAQLEYWQESLERHLQEAAKVQEILDRDRDNIDELAALVGALS